jgi:hypothetical protein
MARINTVIRASIASSAELGIFSSALLLLRICRMLGPEVLHRAVCDYGKKLPLFDALARRGIHPDRIIQWLGDLIVELDEYTTDGIDTLVCTSMEAVFFDQLARHYPCHRLVVVQNDPGTATERVTANYNANFQLIKLHEIDSVADPLKSLLIVPVFDAGTSPLITAHPNVNRILGDDTTAKFTEVIAVDLLGCGFHYYPSNMVQVTVNRFTGIVHLPITGRQESQYVEVC